MTKRELIKLIHKSMPNDDEGRIAMVFDLMVSEIKAAVGTGDTVTIRGLGVFRTSIRKARTINCGAGLMSKVFIATSVVVKFKAADDFRREVQHLAINEG